MRLYVLSTTCYLPRENGQRRGFLDRGLMRKQLWHRGGIKKKGTHLTTNALKNLNNAIKNNQKHLL